MFVGAGLMSQLLGIQKPAVPAGSTARARPALLVDEAMVSAAVWRVTVQVVAGIQTFPLVSSVRTSNGRRPCLAAVARYERIAAKSWAPARVRMHPETFCLIFTIRMSRSAGLLSNGTRRSVAKRR